MLDAEDSEKLHFVLPTCHPIVHMAYKTSSPLNGVPNSADTDMQNRDPLPSSYDMPDICRQRRLLFFSTTQLRRGILLQALHLLQDVIKLAILCHLNLQDARAFNRVRYTLKSLCCQAGAS